MDRSNILEQQHLMLNVTTPADQAAREFYNHFHRWPDHVAYPAGRQIPVGSAEAKMLQERGVQILELARAKLYCFVGPIAREDERHE